MTTTTTAIDALLSSERNVRRIRCVIRKTMQYASDTCRSILLAAIDFVVRYRQSMHLTVSVSQCMFRTPSKCDALKQSPLKFDVFYRSTECRAIEWDTHNRDVNKWNFGMQTVTEFFSNRFSELFDVCESIYLFVVEYNLILCDFQAIFWHLQVISRLIKMSFNALIIGASNIGCLALDILASSGLFNIEIVW